VSKKKTWVGRISLPSLTDPETGARKQQSHWVGRFDTDRERKHAVMVEQQRIEAEGCECSACVATGSYQRVGGSGLPLVPDQIDRYLADYGRRNRTSSLETQRGRLRRFCEDFADRPIDIPRQEFKAWVFGEAKWRERGPLPLGDRQAVVSFYNHALNEDDLPLDRSPARGLSKRHTGRVGEAPPTDDEFAQLVEACAALGDDYGPKMRALVLFAAYTLMRPSELFALEWDDIEGKLINKNQRLYRGTLDDPKTGRKVIFLTPPARDAIAALPRDSQYVFTSKTGKRLSAGSLSGYWALVLARANLDFDFYLATKHFGVHYMWTVLDLKERAIAAQAGWKLSTVTQMLATYGHGDVGALEEVEAGFANAPAAAGTRPRLHVVGGTQT
jgi:integrase